MTRGRQCIICGRYDNQDQGQVYNFPAKLQELDINGVWAHPICIIKLRRYREALRKVYGGKEI